MAKYQLIIEADDEEDLVSGVSRLAELLAGEESDAPAADKPTRGRPRKPKTETTAASATAASGGQAASPDPSPGSAAGQTATAAASPSEITRDVLIAKITEGIDKIGAEHLGALLAGKGLAPQVSKIDAADYAKAVKIIDDALSML